MKNEREDEKNKWLYKTIEIRVVLEGTVKIKAFCCRGLAVHPVYGKNGYTITHIKSGMSVVKKDFNTKSQALTVAKSLLNKNIDWTVEKNQLLSKLRELGIDCN